MEKNKLNKKRKTVLLNKSDGANQGKIVQFFKPVKEVPNIHSSPPPVQPSLTETNSPSAEHVSSPVNLNDSDIIPGTPSYSPNMDSSLALRKQKYMQRSFLSSTRQIVEQQPSLVQNNSNSLAKSSSNSKPKSFLSRMKLPEKVGSKSKNDVLDHPENDITPFKTQYISVDDDDDDCVMEVPLAKRRDTKITPEKLKNKIESHTNKSERSCNDFSVPNKTNDSKNGFTSTNENLINSRSSSSFKSIVAKHRTRQPQMSSKHLQITHDGDDDDVNLDEILGEMNGGGETRILPDETKKSDKTDKFNRSRKLFEVNFDEQQSNVFDRSNQGDVEDSNLVDILDLMKEDDACTMDVDCVQPVALNTSKNRLKLSKSCTLSSKYTSITSSTSESSSSGISSAATSSIDDNPTIVSTRPKLASQVSLVSEFSHMEPFSKDSIDDDEVGCEKVGNGFGKHVGMTGDREDEIKNMECGDDDDDEPPLFHRYGRHEVVCIRSEANCRVIEVKCAVSGALRKVFLKGFWADTKVDEGDWVNVLGNFDENCECVISDSHNLIIVHPDLLISGTTVSSSVQCIRKVVLNEKFKYLPSKKSHHLLYGTAIHSVFQTVLRNRITSSEEMAAIADDIMRGRDLVKEMYSQGVWPAEIRTEIDGYLPQLKQFIDSHTQNETHGQGYQQHGSINIGNSFRVRPPLVPLHDNKGNKQPQSEVVITKVVDIEECVWCPKLGLKGKVDVTAEVKIHSKAINKSCTSTIPIELKTGKTSYSAEHMGQVTLYMLMLDCLAKEEERKFKCSSGDDDEDNDYNDGKGGLLVYLKTCSSKVIPMKRTAVCGLIQLRNTLAYHLKKSSKRSSFEDAGLGGLPDVIYDERTCGYCDQRLNCCLYQKSFEKEVRNSPHPMSKIVPSTLSHLKEAHQHFFHRLCTAHHLEETTEKFRRAGLNESNATNEVPPLDSSNIWLSTIKSRVEQGICVRNLILHETSPNSDLSEQRHNFKLVFKPQQMPVSHCLIGEKQHGSDAIIVGDMVLISRDDGDECEASSKRVAVASGMVSFIHEVQGLEVLADSDMSRYMIPIDERQAKGDGRKPKFRIDKVESFSSLSLNLSNLSRLMLDDPVSQKLRELIIDMRPPTFLEKLSKNILPKIQPFLKKCNQPQKSAILKAILCEDFVLIKGYPGTGKTTTISTLVQILTCLGHSVLLTSYTHSAIDNILIKLIEKGVDVLRLGRSSKRVHPKVVPFLDATLIQSITSPEDLDKFYSAKMVVATTCLGINHPVFMRRNFDYCIVDESSQSLMASCIGPLFSCKKFVLVGDPDQLPPVVQDKEARMMGLDRSLFTHLENQGATYELSLQYRMNKEIMRLSNELIYFGRLECGSESVASGKLHLPLMTDEMKLSISMYPDWLQSCIDVDEEVIWLDTSSLNQESASPATSTVTNHIEASLISVVVQLFVKVGVSVNEIGVISPYKAQVSLLKRTLNSQKEDMSEIEVNTIDQYQGRDKEIVLVSFVKWGQESSKETNNNGILNDKRRLNVALTRAKFKVILVGHASYLTAFEPLRKLISGIIKPQQMKKIENMSILNKLVDVKY